ncbi:MAG: SHOCT domain-containing protein [Anaerolineales bacterium]
MTAEEQAALSGEGSTAPAASTSGAPPAPAATGPSYVNELEQLADLRDRGIITDDDFETKKKELLGL